METKCLNEMWSKWSRESFLWKEQLKKPKDIIDFLLIPFSLSHSFKVLH